LCLRPAAEAAPTAAPTTIFNRHAAAALLADAVTVKVLDRRETYKACARSWKRRPDVGEDPDYADLTLRDAAAVKSIKN
jgi:isoleucyl-tRNA synthetase